MTNYRKRYSYYYKDIERLRSFVVPEGVTDYVTLFDTIGSSRDIEKEFKDVRAKMDSRGRLLVTFHNYLWEPLFTILEALRIKDSAGLQNWLSTRDVKNLLYLADFEVVRSGRRMLFPIYIPLISTLLNWLGQFPLINRLCITQYIIARPIQHHPQKYSVSIVVPARNEHGNIENIVRRIPEFGTKQEIIFIEGHSRDDTWEEIQRVAKHYKGKKHIVCAQQDGTGKGDAVRKGFSLASNEMLMILDADMTVAPEDLPRFYEVIAEGKADFVNGSRLVYPMEKEAMRFLNNIANKCFALLFSWLLDQQIKDTLCGTKVLLAQDYQRIAENRHYFGNFDPFGDFDLLFGAVKQNMKILDVPIIYHDRTYGTTQIRRFAHGVLLLQMCIFAARKIKFY